MNAWEQVTLTRPRGHGQIKTESFRSERNNLRSTKRDDVNRHSTRKSLTQLSNFSSTISSDKSLSGITCSKNRALAAISRLIPIKLFRSRYGLNDPADLYRTRFRMAHLRTPYFDGPIFCFPACSLNRRKQRKSGHSGKKKEPPGS